MPPDLAFCFLSNPPPQPLVDVIILFASLYWLLRFHVEVRLCIVVFFCIFLSSFSQLLFRSLCHKWQDLLYLLLLFKILQCWEIIPQAFLCMSEKYSTNELHA